MVTTQASNLFATQQQTQTNTNDVSTQSVNSCASHDRNFDIWYREHNNVCEYPVTIGTPEGVECITCRAVFYDNAVPSISVEDDNSGHCPEAPCSSPTSSVSPKADIFDPDETGVSDASCCRLRLRRIRANIARRIKTSIIGKLFEIAKKRVDPQAEEETIVVFESVWAAETLQKMEEIIANGGSSDETLCKSCSGDTLFEPQSSPIVITDVLHVHAPTCSEITCVCMLVCCPAHPLRFDGSCSECLNRVIDYRVETNSLFTVTELNLLWMYDGQQQLNLGQEVIPDLEAEVDLNSFDALELAPHAGNSVPTPLKNRYREDSVPVECIDRKRKILRKRMISHLRDIKYEPQMFPFFTMKHELAEEERSTLEDLVENLGQLGARLPTGIDAQRVADSVASHVKGFSNDLVVLIPTCATFTYAVMTFMAQPSKKWGAIATATGLFMMAKVSDGIPQFVKTAMDSVLRFLGKTVNSAFTPHMHIDDLSNLFTIITSLLSLKIVNMAPDGKKLTEFSKQVSAFSRFNSGVKDVFSASIGLFESAINYIRNHVLGLEEIEICSRANEEVDRWSCKIKDMLHRAEKRDLAMNMVNFEAMLALYHEGEKLQSKYYNDTNIYRLVSTIMDQFRRLKYEFESRNFLEAGNRQQPLTVMLAGPPGIGKSAAVNALLSAVLPKIMDSKEQIEAFKDNMSSAVYNWNQDSEHHDTYNNQFAVVMDDYGQKITLPGSGSDEHFSLIKASNIFAFPMVAAAIEKKGNTFFRSKFILVTTNLKHIKPKTVQEPEAVERRFDFIIHCAPLKEYCTTETQSTHDIWNRRLDHTKVHGYMPEVMEYHVIHHDKQTGMLQDVKTLGFGELCSELINRYGAHKDNYENYNGIIAKIRQDACEEALKFMPQMDTSSFKQAFEAYIKNDITKDTLKSFVNVYDDLGSDEHMEFFEWIDSLPNLEKEKVLDTIIHMFIDRGEINVHMATYNIITTYWEHVKSAMGHGYERVCYLFRFIAKQPEFIAQATREVYCKSISKRSIDIVVKAYMEFSNFCNSVKTKILEFYDKYPVVMNTAMILGAVASLYGLYKLFVNEDKEEEPEFDFEPETINHRGRKVISRVNRLKLQHQRAISGAAVLQPEGGFDQNMYEECDTIFQNHLYKFYDARTNSQCGYGLAVKNRAILVPLHFATIQKSVAHGLGISPKDYKMYLQGVYSEQKFYFSLADLIDGPAVKAIKGQDAVIFEMPSNFPMRTDITKYFKTNKSHEKVGVATAYMRMLRGDIEYNEHFRVQPMDNVNVSQCDEPYTIRKCYIGKIGTKVGDCGLPVFIPDPSSRAEKIIGIHGAGNSDSYSICVSISQEELLDALKLLSNGDIHIPDSKDYMPQGGLTPYGLDFDPRGELPVTIGYNVRTDIVPTPIKDTYKMSKTKPAKLAPFRDKDGEMIDPNEIALKKQIKQQMPLDPEMVAVATQDYGAFFENNSPIKVERKIWSFEQAVEGVVGEPDIAGLPRGTSAGYPWSQIHKGKGKKPFFGEDGDYTFDSEECQELREKVESIEADFKKGICHKLPFQDSLKDELRPKAKVDAGKTRLISGSCLEHTILTRMYFGAFCVSMLKNRIVNGCTVGINCFGQEAQVLVDHLCSKSDGQIAGDFSSFDASQQNIFFEAIVDVINDWYNDGPENARVRRCLNVNMFNSTHVFHNIAYDWRQALPSGCGLTTVLNSFLVNVLFRCAWILAHSGNVDSIADFNKHITMVANGDDNVVNISVEAQEFFNQETIPVLMDKLGFEYTNEHKGGEVAKVRKVGEWSFLKRTPIYNALLGRYVLALDLDVILEMPMWSKRGINSEEILKEKIKTALMELSLHGPEVFRQWSVKIIDASVQYIGYRPEVVSYGILVRKSASEIAYF